MQTPLSMDIFGVSCKETNKWGYAVAVGIIQYLLSRNEFPDVTLAINQVDLHTHNPNFSHDI